MLFTKERPRWDYRHSNIDRARGTIARSSGTSEGHPDVRRELHEIKDVGNKGKRPLFEASCLNVRQVAVTCRRGTSVVRNLKFLTPFFNSKKIKLY